MQDSLPDAIIAAVITTVHTRSRPAYFLTFPFTHHIIIVVQVSIHTTEDTPLLNILGSDWLPLVSLLEEQYHGLLHSLKQTFIDITVMLK